MLPAENASPLPPERAFVVQIAAEADVAAGCCRGRVEHVVSGRATHFVSAAELFAFVARTLRGDQPADSG